MRTTITLDESLVAAVRSMTRERTKTRAVTFVLTEYLRRKKIEELRGLLGKVQIDEKAIAAMEQAEMKAGG